ncbi:MAG: hypothetical protein ACSHX8_13785 [Opitutaceae bacterium]
MSSQQSDSNNPHAHYNRPTAKWECGHATDGCTTCPLGPSSKGQCRASGECQPQLKDDRYYCTRPKNLGGPCSEGPLPDGGCANIIPPCNPTLSTRALRGRVCLIVAITTIALLILILSGPSAEKHISAGPLSIHHSTATSSCVDCHSTLDADSTLSSELFDLHTRAQANSQKCLECHSLGEHPLQPHSLSPSELARLTSEHTDTSNTSGAFLQLASQLSTTAQSTDSSLACASCHTEHKGPEFDLKAMSNAQCQSCHQAQFHEFAKDHPSFDRYPYDRSTRIIFDHESHLLDHFNKPAFKDLAANDCMSCHEIDTSGALMQTRSFEQSCAACHSEQIEGTGRAGALGIATLQLPGIDTETLASKGYPVGDWPEYADGEITSFMDAVFRQNPTTNQHLNSLEEANRLDLRNASDAQLEAASGLLWAVKELFFDALTTDQQFLQQQILADSKQTEISGAAQRLNGQLPFDTLLAAQQAWFPNLLLEVPQYRKGQFVGESPPTPAIETVTKPDTAADDTLDTGDGLLLNDDNDGDLLMMNDTEDDGLLSNDSDLLSMNEDEGGLLSNDSDLLGTNDDESDLLAMNSDDDAGLLESNASDDGGLLDLNESDDAGLLESNDGGGLLDLNENDDGGLLMSNDTSDDDGLLSANDDSSDLLANDDLSAENSLATNDKPVAEPAKAAELKSPEVWSSQGGWYRNDNRYVLYYRPTGHADNFISEWINTTAPMAHEASPSKVIFDQLTADKAPGLCMKCHSVDVAPSGHKQVNWTAKRPTPQKRTFTKFRHAPHLMRQDDAGCMQCHTLKTNASPDNSQHAVYSGNFENIDNNLCVSCHNQDNANNHCLLCHNYHVGEFDLKLPQKTLETYLQPLLDKTADME